MLETSHIDLEKVGEEEASCLSEQQDTCVCTHFSRYYWSLRSCITNLFAFPSHKSCLPQKWRSVTSLPKARAKLPFLQIFWQVFFLLSRTQTDAGEGRASMEPAGRAQRWNLFHVVEQT